MTVLDVAAGLIFRRERLLVTQRREGDSLGGFWEFPGGKREPGESWESCLKRELTEELGVEVAVGPLWETVDHVYPERQVHLRFFLCRLVRREPQTIGCQDLRWIRREELGGFKFPPADARLIERLSNSPDLWTMDTEPPAS